MIRTIFANITFAASALCTAADQSASDFEKGTEGWTYYGGVEFPGAQGGLDAVTEDAVHGRKSLRIHGDFTNGGKYVAAAYTLPKPLEIGGMALWAKSDDISSLGIRVVDSTGQTFQYGSMPFKRGKGWQEVVLTDLAQPKVVWGGAGDKVFHQPAKSCMLTFGPGPQKTTIVYVDMVRLTLQPASKR